MIEEPKSWFQSKLKQRERQAVFLSISVIVFMMLLTSREDLANISSQYSQQLFTSLKRRIFAADPEADFVPLILDWTTVFGWNVTNRVLKHCPQLECEFTSDKKRLNQSAVVFFHARDFSWNNIPKTRLPWQRYVFSVRESPMHTGISNLNQIPGFFNWTMTYRLDSDIHYGYESIAFSDGNGSFLSFDQTVAELLKTPGHNLEDKSNKSVDDIIANKTKAIAWFVSNCHTSTHREDYVAKLRLYIPVDIYGACGKRKCRERNGDCENMLEKDYFFYIAFENSNCRDYITEKIGRRLRHISVPIVIDSKVIEGHLPNGSYIAATDFKSASELAKHLHFLMNNSDEYRNYFDWRQNLNLTAMQLAIKAQTEYCGLCQMAKMSHEVPEKSYWDLSHWWNDEGNCRNNVLLKHIGYTVTTKL